MATAAVGFVTEGFPASGLRKTQRLITGDDDDGKGQAVAVIPYSTNKNPVDLNDNVDVSFAMENKPGQLVQNGTVVRVIDFGPGFQSPLHSAMSIEYGIVLEGEFELALDSGERSIMRRGDVSVTRATAHTWRNVTDGGKAPGRMVYMVLGCKQIFASE